MYILNKIKSSVLKGKIKLTEFFNIFQKSDQSISKVKLNSAVNSLIIVVSCFSLPCLCLSAFSPFITASMRLIIIIAALCPLIILCFSYLYLLFKKPDYLRSEEFHIQKIVLETFGEKGIEYTADQLKNMRLLTKSDSQLSDSNKGNANE